MMVEEDRHIKDELLARLQEHSKRLRKWGEWHGWKDRKGEAN